MRILITGSLYLPLDVRMAHGGIEEIAMGTYKAVSAHTKVKMYVGASSDSYLPKTNRICWQEESQLSWNKREKANGGRWPSPMRRESFDPFLQGIKDERIDAVVSNLGTVGASRKLAELGIPVITLVHEGFTYQSTYFYFRGLHELKEEFPNFKVLAVSKYVMDEINEKMPGMVDDYLLFTHSDPGYFEEKAKKLIVFSGRIMEDKGPLLAIQSMTGHSHKLMVAGEPHTYSKFSANYYFNEVLPAAKKAPNVKIWGECMDQATLWEVSASAAAVLVPSVLEAFCLSAFESQKMGVPVVALGWSRPSGIEEFLEDGITGVIVPSYRVRHAKLIQDFREGIDRAIDLDRKAIWKRFNERYSPEKFAKSFVKKVKELSQ